MPTTADRENQPAPLPFTPAPAERETRWRLLQAGFALLYLLLFAGVLLITIPQALNPPKQGTSASSYSSSPPWTISGHPCPGPKIYVPTGENIYVLRAKDGSQCWEAESSNDDPLAYANGVIYTSAASDYSGSVVIPGPVIAVRASDGKLLWSKKVVNTGAQFVTVADDIVYVTTNLPSLSNAADDPQGVYALRASDGTLLWRHPIPTTSFETSLPLVVGNTLYIGVGASLLALDTLTGEQLWTKPLQVNGNTYSALAMSNANGLIYAVVCLDAYGEDVRLLALNAGNGQLRWNVALGSLNGLSPISAVTAYAPVVDNGIVYVGSMFGQPAYPTGARLYAIRASDGKPLWHYDLLNPPEPSNGVIDSNMMAFMFSSPVISDGLVYTSNLHELLALSSITGQIIWRRQADITDQPAGLALANGMLIVHIGGISNPTGYDTVVALNAADGAQLWQRSLEDSSEGNTPLFLT